MFASLKIPEKRIFIGVVLAAVIIILVVLFSDIFHLSGSGRKRNGKTDASRTAFLRTSGLDCESRPCEIKQFFIPTEFDITLEEFCKIQKKSGFCFDEYKGRTAVRYSYKLKNSESVCDLVVCDGEIIAVSTILQN